MSSRYVQKSITLNLKFQRYPSPFAVGIDNAVRVVYHGDTEYGYPNGIPASGGRVIEITKGFSDEIELKYQTPDPNNRWDDF